MKYVAALKGLPDKQVDKRVRELLESVGLWKVRKKKTRTFSGGMRQRLGIAQAMLNDPHILILDEPTAGLDPKERVRFRNILSVYARDRIVILSTHIVSDVESVAEKIILMKDGKILQFGTAKEITKDLRGYVWECEVPERMAEQFALKYPVSSLRNMENGGVLLRVIAKERPSPAAIMAKPCLEDLYMYHFRE